MNKFSLVLPMLLLTLHVSGNPTESDVVTCTSKAEEYFLFCCGSGGEISKDDSVTFCDTCLDRAVKQMKENGCPDARQLIDQVPEEAIRKAIGLSILEEEQEPVLVSCNFTDIEK